jgi:large conductance mechanosensitive channel
VPGAEPADGRVGRIRGADRKERGMFKDFKAFVMRGNVVDMAVGIIIGAAFGTIVQSFVNDVIMPPIGLLLGDVDFTDMFAVLKQGEAAGPYATLADAQAAGAVTLNWGVFITTIVTFLIIAFAVFMMIRALSNMQKKEEEAPAEPTTKECPHCFTVIPIKATRCPACTSQLQESGS